MNLLDSMRLTRNNQHLYFIHNVHVYIYSRRFKIIRLDSAARVMMDWWQLLSPSLELKSLPYYFLLVSLYALKSNVFSFLYSFMFRLAYSISRPFPWPHNSWQILFFCKISLSFNLYSFLFLGLWARTHFILIWFWSITFYVRAPIWS